MEVDAPAVEPEDEVELPEVVEVVDTVVVDDADPPDVVLVVVEAVNDETGMQV